MASGGGASVENALKMWGEYYKVEPFARADIDGLDLTKWYDPDVRLIVVLMGFT